MFDYLAVEVLEQQTPELQRFLLDTSILAEMDVPVCNELFGRTDTLALLQLTEKRNLFVMNLGDQGYRYHHLFRDFLQVRLRQTQPERYGDLLRRAAALFERRGKMDQAIEHWLAANEPRDAARLIQIVLTAYYEGGRWTTLMRWLDALPEEVMREAPEMLLSRATLDAEMGAVEAAQQNFESAIAEFGARGDSNNLARTLIESARYEPNLETTIERCERAIAMLPEGEYFIRATGYRVIGGKKALHGDYTGAIPLLERAVALYEITNQRFQQADAEMPLGTSYFAVGERARAMTHFEHARNYWRRSGNSAKLANTLNSIAVALYDRGELEPAMDLLQDALDHAQRAGHLRTEAYILASQGDIYRDQNNLASALEAYTKACTSAEKIRENFLTIYARVGAGDIWRMAGDLETAEHVLETTLEAASSHQSGYQVALAQVAMSALRLAQNQPDSAVRQLEHALPLLEHAQSTRDVGRAHFYLAQAALQKRCDSDALVHLRALAKIGKSLGETQFLVSQVRNAPRVLDYALSHRSGVSYFRQLAIQLEHLPLSDDLPIPELESGLPELELYAFGDARVSMDGKVILQSAWQTTTTKELFFFFATNPKGWRKEEIIDELWMDATRSQANDLFHASMYRLRRALFPDCIVFRDGLYRLNHEAVRWLDVREFEQEYATVMEITLPEQQIEQLERVVALYRGDFLSEFYGDWCIMQREELRLKYLDALALLGSAWFRFGNLRRAEEVYHKALDREPAREETYRELMALYAAMGDRVSVIQTYQQCVEALKTEVGVTPLPETVELFQRLLHKGDR